jgi:N-acylneuraminate cytidylyltransferase
MHVTNPFLRPETLQEAKKLLISFEESSNIAVVGCNTYKSRFWKEGWAKSSVQPVNHNPMELIKTQDLPLMYEENSAFYMFTMTTFYARDNRMGYNPYFLPMEFPENIDIDTEEDWTIANVILRGLKCSD